MSERSLGSKSDQPKPRKTRPSGTKDGLAKTQHARFLEAARDAGADVDTDAADRLMRKLAKTKPELKAASKQKKTPRLPIQS